MSDPNDFHRLQSHAYVITPKDFFVTARETIPAR